MPANIPMKELGDFFVAIGVTGPAALFAIAAFVMLRHILRRSSRDVETNITLATALTTLTQVQLSNKELLERIEVRLSK